MLIPRHLPRPVFAGAVHRIVSALLLLLGIGGFASAASLPPGFIEETVAGGWSSPVGIAHDTSGPNDRVYVWERTGKLWIVENGVKLKPPLVDISEEVLASYDFGLLGVALHPEFQRNGHLYLLYVVDRHHLLAFGTPEYSPTQDLYASPTIGRLTRYTARAEDGFRSIDPASRRVLIGESISTGFPVLQHSHGVGSLLFGTDGMLLVSCGDSASFHTTDDGGTDIAGKSAQALADGIITAKEDVGAFRAQLLDSLNGKIIRVDPATGDGIASNPYFDPANPRSATSRVWVLGLRNPFRMTLRPGSGSQSPADANPGVLYLGDVGYYSWEEQNVIAGPGRNHGWPLFEGLEPNADYQASAAVNLDAPNPLGGHFRFRDLVVQKTLATPSWPNPLDRTQQVPADIPKWTHARPFLDYNHGAAGARVGTFAGTEAQVSVLGSATCPVSGQSFSGTAATGSAFVTDENFPAEYRNAYFFADYSGQWIKSAAIGATNLPTEVRPFASAAGPVVCLSTHPVSGGLYYISFDDERVRRIIYAPGGNQPPVPVASAAPNYGPSPLTVQFNGAGSYDPTGGPLAYFWSFDDGTTSSEANPTKTFQAAETRKFTATLRVTDVGGASTTTSVPVFVNHEPAAVVVTSPIHGAKYPVGREASYPLTAIVTPRPGHSVEATWQTILYHDDHTHPNSPLAGAVASVTTSGEGVGFFYENVLTVTDDLGLTTTAVVHLLPNLANVAPAAALSLLAKEVRAGLPTLLDSAASASDSDSPGLEGGELRIELIGGTASESLSLRNEGHGAGQIAMEGAIVSFGGVNVGSLSGVDSHTLVIAFNAAATPHAAAVVLQNVTYLSQIPGHAGRIARVTMTDGDGGTSTPADLLLTTVENLKPRVQLTSPSPMAFFIEPGSVLLAADASDPDGTIKKVEFFHGSTKIGSASVPPYRVRWRDALAGTYDLRAKAVDNEGAKTWSADVRIHVTGSSAALLSDNFDDRVLNTRKWTLATIAGALDSSAAAFDPAIGITERSQRLKISLRSELDGDHYSGYVASVARDFTGASASVEVVRTAAGFAESIFAVSKDPQNLLLMLVQGGDLYFDHVVDGRRKVTGTAFDPVQHRHWRIRHVAATPAKIYFDTSPDGVRWQTLRRDNAAFDMTAVRPELSAGTWTPEPAPGVAIFDNFGMERGTLAPTPMSNKSPVAVPGGPYTAVAGEALTISAAASTDPDGTIASYAWSFGDGTRGTGASTEKIYAVAGTYLLRLRVTDQLGAFSEATATVTVAPAPASP